MLHRTLIHDGISMEAIIDVNVRCNAANLRYRFRRLTCRQEIGNIANKDIKKGLPLK